MDIDDDSIQFTNLYESASIDVASNYFNFMTESSKEDKREFINRLAKLLTQLLLRFVKFIKRLRINLLKRSGTIDSNGRPLQHKYDKITSDTLKHYTHEFILTPKKNIDLLFNGLHSIFSEVERLSDLKSELPRWLSESDVSTTSNASVAIMRRISGSPPPEPLSVESTIRYVLGDRRDMIFNKSDISKLLHTEKRLSTIENYRGGLITDLNRRGDKLVSRSGNISIDIDKYSSRDINKKFAQYNRLVSALMSCLTFVTATHARALSQTRHILRKFHS